MTPRNTRRTQQIPVYGVFFFFLLSESHVISKTALLFMFSLGQLSVCVCVCVKEMRECPRRAAFSFRFWLPRRKKRKKVSESGTVMVGYVQCISVQPVK